MLQESKIIVLDGGFASQLSTYVGSKIDEDPLWCSRFNATDPDAVLKTHLDFLNAGSECISTNTYQASIEGYMQYLNLTRSDAIELIKRTVGLAHKGVEIFSAKKCISDIPKVIGVIGPYGAHLHDCSEYTGSYASYITTEEIVRWHRSNIEVIVSAGIDILGIMTIPCKIEAKTLLYLMYTDFPNTKFWISFQCKDSDNLADGEKFSEVANFIWEQSKLMQTKNLLAIGINCVNPKFVLPLLKLLNGKRLDGDKIPMLVSPTSGEIYDNDEKEWIGKEKCSPLENYIPQWKSFGLKYIGGCCRTNAYDIERIKKNVNY